MDYKTGRKSFSLSDVMYGLGMQMLLYLFALDRAGERLYGVETAPAGVLYIPAREVLLSEEHDLTDEELEKKRLEKLRRSGLVLDEPEVLRAMERGDGAQRLPSAGEMACRRATAWPLRSAWACWAAAWRRRSAPWRAS